MSEVALDGETHSRREKMIGRYIVSDARICHGQPTFRGTRILVADVLEQVAAGLVWETIVEEWRGSVSADAIAEAVRLANRHSTILVGIEPGH